jgi:hypothetical protein
VTDVAVSLADGGIGAKRGSTFDSRSAIAMVVRSAIAMVVRPASGGQAALHRL